MNKGGELRLSKSTGERHIDWVSDSESDSDSDSESASNRQPVKIQVHEGTSIVFRNDRLSHQV